MLWHVIQPAPRSATSRYILELASLAAQQKIVVYSSTSDADRHDLRPDVASADVLKGLSAVSLKVWRIADNLVALSLSEGERGQVTSHQFRTLRGEGCSIPAS